MVTNTVVPPGEEVFNTYGEDLSNADLLVRYGFMSDVNENDRVSFPISIIPDLDLDLSALEELELVLGPGLDGAYIDSDGVMSRQLFLHVTAMEKQSELDDILSSKAIVQKVVDFCTERKDHLGKVDVDHLDVSPSKCSRRLWH